MEKFWKQYGRSILASVAAIVVGLFLFRSQTPESWQNPQTMTTAVSLLLAVYVLARSKTPEILKAELEATRMRCDRYEEENANLQKQVHTKDVEIAELKAKTDLSQIQKTQHEILAAIKSVGETMNSVANTMQRITAVLPLSAELTRTPPPAR